MENWKVYLAGSFKGGWRSEIKKAVGENINWLEPIVHPDQKKEDEDPKLFVPRDLALIRKADFLAGWWRPESHNNSLSAEIGLAYAWGIPCMVAIPPGDKITARFVRGLVREFDSKEDLIRFLRYL